MNAVFQFILAIAAGGAVGFLIIAGISGCCGM